MPKRAGTSGLLLPPGRPAASAGLLSDGLASGLTAAVLDGTLGPGALLPPERVLAARHGIARVTVRTALAKMVRMGLLERCPRVGYRVAAQLPDDGQAGPVGVIRDDASEHGRNPSRSIGVIERRLGESGRALLIGSSVLHDDAEDHCIRRFKAANVAGLIVTPAVRGVRSAELEAWIRAGRPTVLEGHPGRWLLPQDLAERCDQVDIDNAGAIRTAVEYLCGLGHRRVAYCTSGDGVKSERLAAFEACVREQGFPRPAEGVLTGLADGRSGGAEAFGRLFSGGRRASPTAVITSGSDELALGLIAAARAAGRRVPADLSVISFGDNRLIDDPRGLAQLTALEFSQEDMATAIMQSLADQMAGARHAPRRVRIAVDLVRRGSCGRARAPAAATAPV